MVSWTKQIDNNQVHSTISRRYANGSQELRDHLKPIYDPRDGKTVVGWLVPSAARSWNAMAAHAWRDGVLLLPTSPSDTFRHISVQQRIFNERYTTENTGIGCRTCGGRRFCKRSKKFATAACPGTSNHGKAEAVDFRRLAGTLAWMEAHAKEYGWQWELSSEEWHVHYMIGDEVTQAVLDHEVGAGLRPQEDDDMARVIQCNPGRDEWPEIKPHVFKTSGLKAGTEHVPTMGHGNQTEQLAVGKDGLTYVSPNYINELVSDEVLKALGIKRPTPETHPNLSSATYVR